MGGAVLTITLNAAVDLTYALDHVVLLEVNRVRSVAERAGGKGINVARVLQALGARTVVSGFAGGPTGGQIRADLARAGLPDELERIAGQSRRTVAVVAGGGATMFNEPGPTVTPTEWGRLVDRVKRLVTGANSVVLSGSLPPGVPTDAYAILARIAADADVPAVIDADAEALRAGLAGRPALVKPNAAELAAVTGRQVEGTKEALAACEDLRADGAGSVVVSLGADGLVACTPEGSWQAPPPERVAGNPAGSGDAAVAALTLGLVRGWHWQTTLARAAALAAASVHAPVAGGFDPEAYRRYLGHASAEPI
jgi:1-phosphofructokinase family hexose kinase